MSRQSPLLPVLPRVLKQQLLQLLPRMLKQLLQLLPGVLKQLLQLVRGLLKQLLHSLLTGHRRDGWP